MPLVILHDLNDEEVLLNTDTISAAKRRYPDETSHITEPFTKLYFATRGTDMSGFPDTVKESPAEIAKLSKG